MIEHDGFLSRALGKRLLVALFEEVGGLEILGRSVVITFRTAQSEPTTPMTYYPYP